MSSLLDPTEEVYVPLSQENLYNYFSVSFYKMLKSSFLTTSTLLLFLKSCTYLFYFEFHSLQLELTGLLI